MRIFTLIIFLSLTSCASNNTYNGKSAWAKYHERTNSKSIKTSSYPSTGEQNLIPKQKIQYTDVISRINKSDKSKTLDFNSFKKLPPKYTKTFVSERTLEAINTRDDPVQYRKRLNTNVTKLTSVPISLQQERTVFEEKYFSAAGSNCTRKRISSPSGELVGNVMCRKEDGSEQHYN